MDDPPGILPETRPWKSLPTTSPVATFHVVKHVSSPAVYSCAPSGDTNTARTSSRSLGSSCAKVRIRFKSGKDHCLTVKSREPAT